MGEFSISKLRESGCAPVVKLTIFDSIEKETKSGKLLLNLRKYK